MNRMSVHDRDIKKWNRVHEIALEEEDILFLVYDAVENSIGAIAITDLSGDIIYTNKQFNELFQQEDESILNVPITDLFSLPAGTSLSDLIEEISAKSELLLHRSTEETFYAVVITSLVHNLKGNSSGHIFSLIDISKQKELEKEQQQLIAKLKETDLKLRITNSRLELVTLEDALTGLSNRRAFDIQYDLEWRRSVRENSDLTLLMIDVDNFKKYNDSYGHQQGDQCLTTIAHTFNEAHIGKRAGDVLARYGGEEFVIVLPHSSYSAGVELGQRIVDILKNKGLPHVHNCSGVVTVSIGVSTRSNGDSTSKETLLKRADEALYKAKQDGRCCVR